MQAVILAAGKGTRMEKYDKTIPKPMLELAPGKPILAHTIDILPEEIDEVIIIVNHFKDQIEKFFGDSYNGKKITYAIQEKLDGTGAAIHICKDMLKDDFIVLMGDDLFHPDDIKKMIECPDYSILLWKVRTLEEVRGGVVQIDEDNNMVDIVEYPDDPKTLLLNTGLYKLKKNFFDYPLEKINPESSEYGLPQTLVKVAKDHPVKAFNATFWQMVNTPEDLGKARAIFPRVK